MDEFKAFRVDGFDIGNGPTYDVKVVGKSIQRIRRIPVPTLKLEPWGARKKANEIKVPWEIYKRVGVGDRVMIDSGPGLLRISWVTKVEKTEVTPETNKGD